MIDRLINEPYNQQKVYDRIINRHILNFGWVGRAPKVVTLRNCLTHHLRGLRFGIEDRLQENLKNYDSYAINMCVVYLEEVELFYKINDPLYENDDYLQSLCKIREAARNESLQEIGESSHSRIIKDFVANPDCYRLFLQMEDLYKFLIFKATKLDLQYSFGELMESIDEKRYFKATKLFFNCLNLSLNLRLKRFLKKDDKHLDIEVE